ncbi:Hypothetical protein, putative [Bodo saltans]|uniref:Uncharacterized protein n=1 Tax=Bodo saltans TaxID=75058 RepID=A0A0S4INW7_BODSA|nr:Hypothetical protein, putative [Bodo saltans]|eukprot:CUE85184.1 Hypothetical protein, putative [Bodo saltans]
MRSTLRRLARIDGEQGHFHVHNTSSFVGNGGGVPFYGNIYAGRVNAQSWSPPPQKGSGLLMPHRNLWDDAAVQAKIQACPYFALCDQVLWQNMDPSFLDPGLLTVEEHQLMLLFSRAYFDKWRSIHTRPENAGPRLRITYGKTALLREMCEFIGVPHKITRSLVREFLMDDAGLIGMNPDCWDMANLDPANRDHLSGRVLEYAGLSLEHRQTFLLLITQMRRIRIVRKDLGGPEPETLILPYREAPTLYDLYVKLGLEPYSGQIKTYDLVNEHGTALSQTMADEDAFFDFLVTSFYKPNLVDATLGGMADASDLTSRYTLTVEAEGTKQTSVGRWF